MNKKMRISAVLLAAVLFAAASCSSNESSQAPKDTEGARVMITAGEAWFHDFPVFAGITKKNSPQFAVWLEDEDGNFVRTIAVSEKLAKEKWVFNGGNRRIEALPLWSHRQGRVFSDGLVVPSAEEPLPDAVSAASEKGSFSLPIGRLEGSPQKRFIIFAEFNHSIDFNESWPKDAAEGSTGYSGGEFGSGQPAIVYSAGFSRAELDAAGTIELHPAGRSSADGSDGLLYTDLAGMTSALGIVASVLLNM